MSDYGTDHVLWSDRQADLLRRRADGDLVNESNLDWQNLAEEIESVGSSERRALASRIGTVIEHLLKLEASPSIEPRAGWQETIIRARSDLDAILEDSPSLRPTMADVVSREMARQRRLVISVLALYGEVPRIPLDSLKYDVDQILGPWLPENPSP